MTAGYTRIFYWIEQLDFLRIQTDIGFGRRHFFVRVGRGDPEVEFASSGVAGLHDGETVLRTSLGRLFEIQPEFGFAGVVVGTVALVAAVGEDGADLRIKVDFVGERHRRAGWRTAGGCDQGDR